MPNVYSSYLLGDRRICFGIAFLYCHVIHSTETLGDFQFWKQGCHPIELNSNEKLKQLLDYIHENPMLSGLVWFPWHYK